MQQADGLMHCIENFACLHHLHGTIRSLYVSVSKNRIWIESMNSFEIQCNTEGLQIDKAGISTKIQSQMNKTNDFK